MYLKGIEIQGFKSFADKISLDFNKGITGIVGPNGSGKSNISDAILWVLGEQSAKTLRGNKMEDVIFAGTEKRKALGFAEVSLLLDNSTGLFPLDFPEIKVTRKVYRSGESEYMINGTACRLKDVHELFMDTGLGRDGYSIIGQGKISDILSSKSENRRQIFEEAAGITKYKYRKNEAEKKLAQTNDNLVRLKDIIIEIESQIEPLKAQSEKAKKYLTLYEELKGLEISLSAVSIKSLREDIKKIEQDIEVYQTQLDEIKNSTEKVDEEISDMYKSVQGFDEETEELRIRESDDIREANELNNKIEIYRNNIKHNEENITRLTGEVESSKTALNTLNAEKSQFENQMKSIEEKLQSCNAEIEKVSSALRDFEKNHSESLAEIENIKKDIDKKKEFIAYESARIDNGAVLKQNLNDRINDIKNEVIQKSAEKADIQKELDLISSQLNEQNRKCDDNNSLLESIRQKRIKINAECDSYIKTKNEIILNINRCESNRHILIDMDNEMNGYSKSVKGIMLDYKSGKLRNAELYGPLSQLISVDSKYVTAIEVAFGAAGQNIVTKSEEDAKVAIEYLKKTKLGRVTFLPVSAVKGRILEENGIYTQPGFINIASELVKTDPKFSDIIKNLLGKTVVVDNMDNAILMSRKFKNRFRIVTLSGEVLQAGGAITGGSAAKGAGFLSRSVEIEKLGIKIEEYRNSLNETNAKISEYTNEIANIDNKLKEHQKEKNNLNESIMRLRLSSDSKKNEINNYNLTIDDLNSRLADIQNKFDKLDDDFRDGKITISEKEAEISQLEEKINILNNTLSNANSELSILNEKSKNLDIEKNNLTKDIEVLTDKISTKTREINLNIHNIEINENELSVIQNKINSMNIDITEFRTKLETIEENSRNSKARIQELETQKRTLESKIREYQENSKSVRENLIELTNKKNTQESRREKLEYDLESIINHIWDEYEITYNDMLSSNIVEISNVRQTHKEIADLKQQIKALGSINIDSIEEYKILKERYDFLTVQISDLDESKDKLEKAIYEMMNVMKEQFREKFTIINTKFNSIFKELFGGGRAKLELTEPNNILDSGIEIEAQPPGKKLQSLTLLSGGERAFTAIALLFAILEVRPTPFCILDEIEAALDDVNVYRYADYLKKYCNKTQFIVVTHRRGTMEAANILYGVTMQEKGISKLLELNIDEVAL